MHLPVQPGQERSKGGFTLLEMIAAVTILIFVLSMIMGSCQQRINKARLDQTIQEMMSLAQASLDFYRSNGHWPMTTADLVPNYMYTDVSVSPFGSTYQMSDLNNAVKVSVAAPSGLAENYYQGTLLEILPGNGQDTIEITQVLPHQFSGRLEYENKYLYHQ